MTADPKRTPYERPEVKELLDVREHVRTTGGGCMAPIRIKPYVFAVCGAGEGGCDHGR